MMSTERNLAAAFEAVTSFATPDHLTNRIGALERALAGRTREELTETLEHESVTPTIFDAARTIKGLAGQINVTIHAVGLLLSLPYILEPDERVESLSLGAGNTGKKHDLETDRRIAEFKFITWRGGPESIRQNGLFIDLFNLASADTTKRRTLYVTGKERPLKFLNNRRALRSVLSKNRSVADRFLALYGDNFKFVSEYYATVAHRVDIVDLAEVVPFMRTESPIGDGGEFGVDEAAL